LQKVSQPPGVIDTLRQPDTQSIIYVSIYKEVSLMSRLFSCITLRKESVKIRKLAHLNPLGKQQRQEESMSARMKKDTNQPVELRPLSKSMDHGRIISIAEEGTCLDTLKLNQLEQSFREWVEETPRKDVRLSRWRVLLIFLLIRYTGAKLNEVLGLNPFADIDTRKSAVFFNSTNADKEFGPREVQISENLSREIESALADQEFRESLQNMFSIDSAFVRRKFYERSQACGFAKRLGGPEMIRKARAVELMQCNMPLPVVQTILGHSTPNLTSAYVSFSAEEIQQVTRLFMERESSHKTSARNSFFGKIKAIKRGDIQTQVEIITIIGHTVTTVITNDSVERLGLQEGRLITAEVKAPWIILQKGDEEPECSAENRFNGVIERKMQGEINTEYTIHIPGGIELCAIVSTQHTQRIGFQVGDRVWAIFNSSSVVLRVD
jgi:molybdate transport system regulatory protein